MLAKISLGLSALLSIAVVYLLLNRNAPATTTPNEVPSIAPALTTEGGPRATVLAYLNGDSLNEKYKFITEKSKILESKYKSADRKVSDEYKKREKDAKDLMDYYQQNPLYLLKYYCVSHYFPDNLLHHLNHNSVHYRLNLYR